jgi:hypothetical protein
MTQSFRRSPPTTFPLAPAAPADIVVAESPLMAASVFARPWALVGSSSADARRSLSISAPS